MLAEQEGMCSFKRVCSIPFSDEPLRTRLLREEVQVVPLAGNPTLAHCPVAYLPLCPGGTPVPQVSFQNIPKSQGKLPLVFSQSPSRWHCSLDLYQPRRGVPGWEGS